MKIQIRWWTLVVAAIAALVVVGCSQKKRESASSPEVQQAAPQAAANGEVKEQGESGPTVTPAGPVQEIWTQIAEEQVKLSATIENGQLKDVHHLAFAIRDLVVALADKVGASSPAAAQKLKDLVEQVGASASKLDELGDAGNLSGAQAELAKLDTILKGIKTATR